MTRMDGRELDELRPVKLTTGFSKFAEGSCLIECGNTMVLCNASVEERMDYGGVFHAAARQSGA